MKPSGRDDARPAMEICEEAYHLLRAAPLAALGAYYAGAVPFCLGLIYFANVMEVHPFAQGMLPGLALLVAVLFIWMKTWQARFAQILLAQLRGEAMPIWGIRGALATAHRQGLLQLSAFVVMPIAALLLIPLIRAYGFYQNLSVLDGDAAQTQRALAKDAYVEAQRWPLQAHIILWTLSPVLILGLMGLAWVAPVFFASMGASQEMAFDGLFAAMLFFMLFAMIPLSPLAFVISINLVGAVVLASMLLKSFFDMDTIFSILPSILAGRAFLSIWMALLYLCMDPVLKAAYILRCFYGGALANGDDLRAGIRRTAQRATAAGILLAAGLLYPEIASAQTPDAGTTVTVDANELNTALRTELDGDAYQWRMPRDLEVIASSRSEGFIEKWLTKWANWIFSVYEGRRDWFKDLLDRLFNSSIENTDPTNAAGRGAWIASFMELLISAMLLVLIAAVLVFAFRQWRSMRQEGAELEAAASMVAVSIEDESTEATALPEEAWRRMADEFRAKGEYRLAMRALFLSLLAALAARELIAVRRYKSNAAYARELGNRLQRGHAALLAFREGTLAYECVWYGEQPANADGYDAMLRHHEQVCTA